MVEEDDMISADTIYTNAKIYTMESEGTLANALACRQGRILAIGKESETEVYRDRDTQIVDLQGKTAVPGIIDSHVHYYLMGKYKVDLDLRGKNLKEICASVHEKAGQVPEGTWIVGNGWVNSIFPNGDFPSKELLDEAAPNHPVFLQRVCGNAYWFNSFALRLAGIDGNTPDPEGDLLRDKSGNISGVMLGWTAKAVTDLIPDHTEADYYGILKSAEAEYLKYGITSVSDDGEGAFTMYGAGNGRLVNDVMKKLYADKALRIRVNEAICAPQSEYRQAALREGPEIDLYEGRFSRRAVKIWPDGTRGTRTANMLEPYNDVGSCGRRYYTDDELVKMFREHDETGYQTVCHAIGDGANEQVINCYEKAFGARDTKDRRFKIIHFQLTRPELIQRAIKHRIIGNYQYGQFGEDLEGVDESVGKKRFCDGYDWRGMLDGGGRICGSSDSPLDGANPFEAMYVAIKRTALDGVNQIEPDYKSKSLTRYEALKSYTLDGAFSQMAEDKKGSLEPGKYADFIVLDRDFFACPIEEVKDIQVLRTVIAGETVYEKSQLGH